MVLLKTSEIIYEIFMFIKPPTEKGGRSQAESLESLSFNPLIVDKAGSI